MVDATPSTRADAARNRQRILDAAREAFADTGAETSMAEVARRSGVGSATLYRNFPSRRELLETLLVDEIEEVCAAATSVEGDTAGDRLVTWLRRFYRYVADKRPVVLGLLEHTDTSNPVFNTRGRLLSAAQPLVAAARDAGEIVDDIEPEQILDLVMAIAKSTGSLQYRQPMLDAVLLGLRRPGSGTSSAVAAPPASSRAGKRRATTGLSS
jgi:AcrR family transcriptional regulator